MTQSSQTIIRECRAEDLEQVVQLLADDVLGAGREDAGSNFSIYEQAFAEIGADPRSTVYVAEQDGDVVGCYQLTIIPNLSLRGGRRAQIEGVRVATSARGRRLGEELMRHAIDLARREGCTLVQLTSNRQRKDALHFYERLGFEPTHTGFKLYLQA